MITRILITLAFVGIASIAQAQTCTPVPFNYITQKSTDPYTETMPPQIAANVAASGVLHIFGPAVPAGAIWKIREAGLSTDDGRSWQYMLELATVQPDGTYVYHSLVSPTVAWSTPALGVMPPDTFVMLPGERLIGRVNATPDFTGFKLMFSGFVLPEACLPRVLRLDPPAVGASGGGVPTPDFSSLVTAAQEAAQKLDALAQSVP